MEKQKTVVLGMSGGVDSSVSAYLLKKQGYKVIGVFLRNYPDEESYLDSTCPFIQDRKFAESVAKKLKIPFQGVDYRSTYLNKVIKPMFKQYSKGLTPNPDIGCNSIIKFPALWKIAKKHKADFIATGHYARIKKSKDGFHLLSGKDKNKDQSYFLHDLSVQDLSHSLFPIGNLKKTKVRKIAKSLGFPNWDKHGSTGICFIGKADMKELLKANIKSKPGPVLNPEGKNVGTHPGTTYFTIGEKVGPKHNVKIEDKYRNLVSSKIYVAEKRKNNILVIAPENHPSLKRKEIIITNLHKINPKSNLPSKRLKARIRHLGKLLPGKLTKNKFILNKPEKGIAPGQSICLYKGKELVAAGEIRLPSTTD
ncbi:tRNA 2-thiouridine(34) synthase MnmA [Candidatus Pacearchaeota archaeon]|nr:tRNA 2-thiouridine(34) synthase MnmA [Candidatus Pacearchaeota archaeon]|tara:strand:+ start:2025 stop:3122 length:1098 start_codon:yes stop_codon:yes gene_type:complete